MGADMMDFVRHLPDEVLLGIVVAIVAYFAYQIGVLVGTIRERY